MMEITVWTPVIAGVGMVICGVIILALCEWAKIATPIPIGFVSVCLGAVAIFAGSRDENPEKIAMTTTIAGRYVVDGELVPPEKVRGVQDPEYRPGYYRRGERYFLNKESPALGILVKDYTQTLVWVCGEESARQNDKPVQFEMGARDNVLRGTRVQWTTAMWRWDPNTWRKGSGIENGQLVLVQYK